MILNPESAVRKAASYLFLKKQVCQDGS